MSLTPTEIDESTSFAISAVAKLTGISEHCLRIWERRYGVVEPSRTETKRRRYTQHDVERLVLIKHLVDAGDTISAVAGLTLDQLKERTSHYPLARGENGSASRPRRVRLLVIGERLASLFDPEMCRAEGLEVVETFPHVSAFLAAGEPPSAEAVVFDFPTVHVHTISDMDRVLKATGAHKGILVYGFAARPALASLNRDRIVPLRSPVDLHEIRIASVDPHTVVATHETAPADRPPEYLPPRFSVDELARIASHSTKVECECPHHLVSLIFSLNAFERYSLECRNMNKQDEELHAYLHKMTSKARAIMEEALVKVGRADGIL